MRRALWLARVPRREYSKLVTAKRFSQNDSPVVYVFKRQVIDGILNETDNINHHWLAGGSPCDVGCCLAFTSHNPISTAGGLVLCSFIAAFPPLAIVSLMVWQLYPPLAKSSCTAAGSKTQSIDFHRVNFCGIPLPGQHSLGQATIIVDDVCAAVLYVAHAGN
ncbi:hypothetical protein D3C75_816010 [compost metagenome]